VVVLVFWVFCSVAQLLVVLISIGTNLYKKKKDPSLQEAVIHHAKRTNSNVDQLKIY
jgi:hypothetical protein